MLRDLFRQRFRTALTVSGVGLGIFTLIVLGALGENVRRVVDEAKAYAGGLVRLYTKTNDRGINPGITPEDLEQVRSLPEVRACGPSQMLFLDGFDLEDDPLMFMRPMPLVEGIPAASAELIREEGTHLLDGRWLREGDEQQAMVVDWIAARRGLRVGGTIRIRNQDYEIVGLYHAADSPMLPAAMVPYDHLVADLMQPEVERAQRFFRELAKNPLLAPFLPPSFNAGLLDGLAAEFAHKQGSLFRIYMIVPTDRSREGTMALARQLREKLPDLAVIDPIRIEEGMEQGVALLLAITLIVTVISTVVGGLLIVNTMAMAVIERRREIGIKAALGATPLQIALEFVCEAALLALAGAGLGILAGIAAIAVCEPLLLDMVDTGGAMFHLTPRLVLLALVYALSMGVVAGGVPALRAARIDPAVCLREL